MDILIAVEITITVKKCFQTIVKQIVIFLSQNKYLLCVSTYIDLSLFLCCKIGLSIIGVTKNCSYWKLLSPQHT